MTKLVGRLEELAREKDEDHDVSCSMTNIEN